MQERSKMQPNTQHHYQIKRLVIQFGKNEELSAKCVSIVSAGHNNDLWRLLLNLVDWGATMKLWEALLSSIALADTASNETCSYRN